ncbi:hypothetical protein PVAP13_9KG514200 [Panicum virgatum]|uniref:Uncharacterized protein n=1 Tax=Panicum virgatum TaxID=38727 RepID=A0A8T0NXS8_PANVG|nr:hypothetical protein PVAP13_9KG514200 [Panicum virgatum]
MRPGLQLGCLEGISAMLFAEGLQLKRNFGSIPRNLNKF